MDWWVKDLYKIISDVAGAAKKQGGRIECSDVALSGWADGIKQLEAENERLREAGQGMLKIAMETVNEWGLPYIFPYADEIRAMKDALKEGGR